MHIKFRMLSAISNTFVFHWILVSTSCLSSVQVCRCWWAQAQNEKICGTVSLNLWAGHRNRSSGRDCFFLGNWDFCWNNSQHLSREHRQRGWGHWFSTLNLEYWTLFSWHWHTGRKHSSNINKFKMYLIQQRPVKFGNGCMNIYEITTQINITKAHLIKTRAMTILVNF